MSKRLIINIVALTLLGVLSFALMNYFTNKKEEMILPKVEKKLPMVKTQTVSYSDLMIDVQETGRLSSIASVELIAEVSGQILKGEIDLNDAVSFKKGQILLRIFDKEAQLSLKASKSRYLSSIASVLPDLKYDYPENYQNWLDFFGAIEINKPLPDFPKVSSENEKIYLASRNILNDYFTIQSSEIRMEKYVIRAPFNGTFTQVSLEVGSIANPGSHIAKMIRTDVLELQVPLTIEEINYVNKGNKVKVMHQGKTYNGFVNRISDFVDPASQSIFAYVTLLNSTKSPLYEGMYMTAYFAESELKQVMKVPRECVFNFNEVYVVEQGKLTKKIIELAKVDEYFSYIRGLKEDSQLVVETLINASEQMSVQIAK
ncbi:MAG: hypothetical protein B7C24_13835 [Bacteroidetes bacterium 4572_77]|nr:MAG: hypothetical protein B7C24_13835 [Bacteroidetes bacterium 4572_77]